MHPQQLPWSRRSLARVLLILLCVGAADGALWVTAPGWSVGVALLLPAVLVLLGRGPWWRWPAAWIGVGLIAAAALSCLRDPGILALLVSGVASLALLASRRDGSWCVGRTPALAWAVLQGLGWRHLRDGTLVVRWWARHPPRFDRRLPWQCAGWALGLGLAGVFLLLFVNANPLLGQAATDLLAWIGRGWDLLPSPLRVLLWLLLLSVFYAARRARVGAPQAVPTTVPRQGFIDAATLLPPVLWLCNGVFLLPTLLDLVYLSGGVGLPAGMGYGAYAQRGAYPLLAAVLLAVAVVLIGVRPGGAVEARPLLRALVWVWLGQCVLLTLAAAWRLDRYIDVYGLSRWRCATLVWMVLVIGGLLLLALRLGWRRSNAWLVEQNARMTLLILAVCAWIDWGAVIAERNVARDAAGVLPLDAAYLHSLGHPAVSALLSWQGWRDDKATRSHLADLRARLEEEQADPRSWTLLRARALEALVAAVVPAEYSYRD